MGSRSKINLAYIAGFLDGDGSLMLQLKKRNDNKYFRFMATICFYQDSRHEKTLYWIRDVFEIGYISKRSDRITELRVNGYQQIERILEMLKPYIKFKKVQTQKLLEAIEILKRKPLEKSDYERLIELMFAIQNQNYKSGRRRSKEEIRKILELTP